MIAWSSFCVCSFKDAQGKSTIRSCSAPNRSASATTTSLSPHPGLPRHPSNVWRFRLEHCRSPSCSCQTYRIVRIPQGHCQLAIFTHSSHRHIFCLLLFLHQCFTFTLLIAPRTSHPALPSREQLFIFHAYYIVNNIYIRHNSGLFGSA